MAKYTINHRCGHQTVVDLVGKNADRQRMIEWREGQDCPKCWGEKKRAEEATQPITANIYCNGIDKTQGGDLVIEIVLTGGTINKKDEIKAAGFWWQEIRGGIMNFLSVSRPQKAWTKMVAYGDLETQVEMMKSLCEKIVSHITPVDIAMMQQSAAKKQEQKEAAGKIEKPVMPACHPKNKGSWNGKYYGSAGRWNYYVDNKNYKMSDAEYAECMAYHESVKEYNEKIEAIKNN